MLETQSLVQVGGVLERRREPWAALQMALLGSSGGFVAVPV